MLSAASRVVVTGVTEQPPEKLPPTDARQSSCWHCSDDELEVFTHAARMLASVYSLSEGETTPGPNVAGLSPVLTLTRFCEVTVLAALARPAALVPGSGVCPSTARN